MHCLVKFLTQRAKFRSERERGEVKQFAVHFSNQFHYSKFVCDAVEGGWGHERKGREKRVIELKDFLISSVFYFLPINYPFASG